MMVVFGPFSFPFLFCLKTVEDFGVRVFRWFRLSLARTSALERIA